MWSKTGRWEGLGMKLYFSGVGSACNGTSQSRCHKILASLVFCTPIHNIAYPHTKYPTPNEICISLWYELNWTNEEASQFKWGVAFWSPDTVSLLYHFGVLTPSIEIAEKVFNPIFCVRDSRYFAWGYIIDWVLGGYRTLLHRDTIFQGIQNILWHQIRKLMQTVTGQSKPFTFLK